MNDPAKNWFISSEYDFETASKMLESGRYLYVIFMYHLSIEKRLKGLIQIKTGTLPPRSHDLIHLSNLAGVKYDTDLGDFIGKLSNASVVTRYPADLEESLSSYPSDVAGQYLKKTEEVLKWLKAA